MNNYTLKSLASRWIGLGLLLLFALILIGCQAPAESGTDSIVESAEVNEAESETLAIPDGLGGLSVGDTPVNFTLEDIDGNEVSLADFAGQPVMINFWATWCAPCRLEMPHIQAQFEKHQADGFVVLALNQMESAEIVSDFFYDEMGLTFTPLLDKSSKVSRDFGAYRINPSSYFINRDGTVSHVHRGLATEGQLEEFIEAIINS